jgi:hypothetical protein
MQRPSNEELQQTKRGYHICCSAYIPNANESYRSSLACHNRRSASYWAHSGLMHHRSGGDCPGYSQGGSVLGGAIVLFGGSFR